MTDYLNFSLMYLVLKNVEIWNPKLSLQPNNKTFSKIWQCQRASYVGSTVFNFTDMTRQLHHTIKIAKKKTKNSQKINAKINVLTFVFCLSFPGCNSERSKGTASICQTNSNQQHFLWQQQLQQIKSNKKGKQTTNQTVYQTPLHD